MTSEQLTLVHPDRRTHRQAIIDLTGKTFGHTYWDWLVHCRRSYVDRGPYDWSASTVGFLGDEIVTHWGVWRIPMRIGRAVVRVGGIGAVSTHGEMRKRGLMAQTATASIEAMRREGYDLSLLFGISDFYPRFGYVRAWADNRYVAQVRDLPTGRLPGRLRRIAPRHRDDLARLYNRTHASLTGTAVRPTYLQHDNHWQGYAWSDTAGQMAGYVFAFSRWGHFGVYDSAGPADDVLRAVARIARRAGEKEVRFESLHEDSDLARRLRAGNCRAERGYHRCGGPMVRTIHLASTLGKLRGELSRRLRRSHLAGWRGRLLIADSHERVVLAIHRGKVSVAENERTAPHGLRGGDAIAQLLLGTDDPHETAAAGGIRLRGDGRRLLGVLFPSQHPQLGPWDHF